MVVKKKQPATVLVALRVPRKLARALRAQAKRERATLTAIIIRALHALPEFSEQKR